MLGKRIAEIRAKLGNKSQEAFGMLVDGSSKQTINNWESGRNKPSFEQAIKIAELGQVSLDWLLRGEEVSTEQVSVLTNQKQEATTNPHPFTDTVTYTTINRFPIASLLGAGSVTPFEDDPTGYIELPYPDKNCVGMKVIGDSMAPRFEEGDIVLVSNHEKPAPGDVVALRLKSGEQIIKRYAARTNGAVVLLSDNASYHPQTVQISDLITFRKVVFALKTLQTPGLTIGPNGAI